MGIKKKHVPGCTCCNVANCCSNTGTAIPSLLTFTVSGLSGFQSYGFPSCTVLCDDLNGTWVVPNVPALGVDCRWYYEKSDMICNNTGDPWVLGIRATYGQTASNELFVEFVWNTLLNGILCFKQVLAKPCSSWSAEAVGTDCGSVCTGGSMTVTA